jgi:hypothetical protein
MHVKTESTIFQFAFPKQAPCVVGKIRKSASEETVRAVASRLMSEINSAM